MEKINKIVPNIIRIARILRIQCLNFCKYILTCSMLNIHCKNMQQIENCEIKTAFSVYFVYIL